MISVAEMYKEEIYSRDEVYACSDVWVESEKAIFSRGGNFGVLLEKLDRDTLIAKESYEVI